MKETVGKIDRNVLDDFELNRFESHVVGTLIRNLENPDLPPILTNDEDDLLIDSDAVYFASITRAFTPQNAAKLVRSGELTDKEVSHKQRVGRAVVRTAKSDMFIERAMTATYATDVCRTYFRYVSGRDFIPVYDLENPEDVHTWTQDYVRELFQAGRDRRLLRGAAIVSTNERIINRFEFGGDEAALLTLTAMTGLNARKKINFWIDQLHSTSKGFERIGKESERKLMGYVATRPETFFFEPDLFQLISDKANSTND